MNKFEAQKIIEELRKGIPPDGYVHHFTVGRKSEIDTLNNRLSQQEKGALLLKANYGSGKTHLLRFIKERALQEGYIVSSVALDAKGAVRFNRMDQMLGAICRGLEVPHFNNQRGIRPFFNHLCDTINSSKLTAGACVWRDLTNNWRWDFSQVLEAPALFIAIRAWFTDKPSVHDLIEAWLFEPWIYRSQRKMLYEKLILELRNFFRDPRSNWQFYDGGIFEFHSQNYFQSWAILRDFHKLAKEAGFKGFIILFDEFEDVIQNLKNVRFQQMAFWNLFEFYLGGQFDGMTYFAVTPDFAQKCKMMLLDKGIWDYDFSMFDKLPTFEMSPLTVEELENLAMKILDTHGIAYDWEPDLIMKISELTKIVTKAASIKV
ncbi:MAG TPA: DUF2791 family P-loop domain-containing protein, partial [Thermodesulfobacteriota bacterium]|nr:DUF2791 family P-loop domain-containing protein [Thermodesulfobacteriota bacterium]